MAEETKELLEKLGTRLRKARKARGLTMEQMASKVFIARKTLQRLEEGDASVTLATMSNVLLVLKRENDLERLMENDRVAEANFGSTKSKKSANFKI